MPVLPPSTAQVYDSLNTVLIATRARLNDEIPTLAPVSGKILQNTQNFSLVTVNNAWRNMQDCLANRGFARLINEVVIHSFPVVASLDPSVQTWLGWSGCFDGQNYFTTPNLPSDFTHPLKIWERWSNQNAQFGDPPMEKILDGIPAVTKTTAIRFWEWRGDLIYMPGSQQVEDLRIRYVNFLPDFTDVGNVPWFQQPVPIARVVVPFSWFICAELVQARGDAAGEAVLLQKGESALNKVFNLDVKADQRVNIRRRPRMGRYSRGWI